MRYCRKLGEGRVFEFRAGAGLRTGKALTGVMDPGAWDGRFMCAMFFTCHRLG